MAKYVITGAAGAASSTAATAGIVKVDNAATVLSTPMIAEFSVGPGAVAEDSNYAVQLKRQTTAGTWTSITPAALDPGLSAAKATGGRASTAAGTGSTVLGIWGFNQRGGIRIVAVPGYEWCVDRANSAGIILEYLFVAGTAVNYGTIAFDE